VAGDRWVTDLRGDKAKALATYAAPAARDFLHLADTWPSLVRKAPPRDDAAALGAQADRRGRRREPSASDVPSRQDRGIRATRRDCGTGLQPEGGAFVPTARAAVTRRVRGRGRDEPCRLPRCRRLRPWWRVRLVLAVDTDVYETIAWAVTVEGKYSDGGPRWQRYSLR
jgi:hypothetical protein